MASQQLHLTLLTHSSQARIRSLTQQAKEAQQMLDLSSSLVGCTVQRQQQVQLAAEVPQSSSNSSRCMACLTAAAAAVVRFTAEAGVQVPWKWRSSSSSSLNQLVQTPKVLDKVVLLLAAEEAAVGQQTPACSLAKAQQQQQVVLTLATLLTRQLCLAANTQSVGAAGAPAESLAAVQR
jgi:hypothetical protein